LSWKVVSFVVIGFGTWVILLYFVSMAVVLNCLIEILKKPAIGEIFSELTIFFAPLWIALAVGLFVGWAWRPSWAVEKLGFQNSDPSANEEKNRIGFSVNLSSRGTAMEKKEVTIR
jgi:hypothetical protein